MRLIGVDAAKKAVHEEFDECLVWDESGKHTANVIEEILEALPTVEAIPVDFIEKEAEKMRMSENPAMRMNSVILSALIRDWRKNGTDL